MNVQQKKILAYLEKRVTGATDDEIALDLGLTLNTVRPRRSELRAQGRCRASGRTRKARSGREATVWEACDVLPPAKIRGTGRLLALKKASEPLKVAAERVFVDFPSLADDPVVSSVLLVPVRISVQQLRAFLKAWEA